jgi:Fe-S oxidoreductase
MVGDVITDDVLWACTTCQACINACPVFIEPMSRIMDMRRYLVLEESRFPSEVNRTFNKTERNGNIWEFSNNQRGDWAKPLAIPTLAEQPDAEILFWVGCFGSFDQRNRKTVEAFARILQAAGIKFAILGQEEKCTGDPARRIGNEYLYQTLAQENVETLNGYKVNKIVTACPHCFNTIKNEYPQFGGHYEVLHHTQLIDGL